MILSLVFMVCGEQLLRIVFLIATFSTTIITMHALNAAYFILHLHLLMVMVICSLHYDLVTFIFRQMPVIYIWIYCNNKSEEKLELLNCL